jgi:hypothetical protein
MATAPGDTDDRVRTLTRVVALAIVPFLVVAFAVLYPVPTDTGRLFAWPIRPTFTAMMLGGVYLGGAYFFVRAATAKRWHTVAGGFVPVGTFASLMGVATILHWGKFTHTNVAFWTWAALYFTTPFLIFYVWWRQPRAPGTGPEMPVAVARVIAAVGVLAGLTSLFLFLLPGAAVAVWPWTLTPLTARVLGAILSLATAGLGALVDRRWSSARILFEVAAVMLALILVAAVRARAEFAAGNPLNWVFAAGFAGLLAGIAILYPRSRAQDSA